VIVLVFVGLAILLALFSETNSSVLDNLPASIQSVGGVYYTVVSPVIGGLFKLVVPSQYGVDSNGAYIAFAIFLLILVVGTRALHGFFRSQVIAFVLAFIVGLIASRSITDDILNDAIISGGPMIVVAFLLLLVPLMMANRIAQWIAGAVGKGYKFEGSRGLLWIKLGVYVVLGIASFFVFDRLFTDARNLSLTYLAAIIFFAAGDVVLEGLKKQKALKEAESVGKGMGIMARIFGKSKRAGEGLQEELKKDAPAQETAEGHEQAV